MSKAATKLISIKNILVFNNTNEKVRFFTKKGESVPASLSGFQSGQYDIKLLAGKSGELDYFRVQAQAEGEIIRGALFPAKKKTSDKSPDFYGMLEVRIDGSDNNMVVARLSAWKKTGSKANNFLSISVQEPSESDDSAAELKDAAEPIAA